MTPALVLGSLALLGYSAFYLLMCAAFPFGNCRACHGSGKRYSKIFTKAFRFCSRCEGTGRRVRIGRRVFEYLRAEHKTGNR